MLRCDYCNKAILNKKAIIIYSSTLGIFHNKCFKSYVYKTFNCSSGKVKDIDKGLW